MLAAAEARAAAMEELSAAKEAAAKAEAEAVAARTAFSMPWEQDTKRRREQEATEKAAAAAERAAAAAAAVEAATAAMVPKPLLTRTLSSPELDSDAEPSEERTTWLRRLSAPMLPTSPGLQ